MFQRNNNKTPAAIPLAAMHDSIVEKAIRFYKKVTTDITLYAKWIAENCEKEDEEETEDAKINNFLSIF